MKKEIADNFAGVLNLGAAKGYNAFFNTNGNIVKLFPLTKECYELVHGLSGSDGKGQTEDSERWLYGFTEDNCNIAILKKSRLKIGFTSGLDMGIAQFYAPLIVKSAAAGEDIDLSTFDAIEFHGGIVDILHNPDQAIDWKDQTICFTPSDNYTKKYETEINGERFEVTYSICIANLSRETGKLPDLKNDIHSMLKFNFQTPKELSDVQQYYSYAMSLFQFCAGRLNVCSEVRLHKKDGRRPIFVRLNDGFDDYANDLDITKVIRFGYLGKFLPSLLKLLNEDRTRPLLNFLPKRNKDIKNVLYTDVNDICSAFEVEYSCSNSPSSEEERGAARKLAETLINIVDKEKGYPDSVKRKAKSILDTQLKGFTPSLRERIEYICNQGYKYIKSVAEQSYHYYLNVSVFSSWENFQKKIADFVKIRNSTSHSAIVWNDGIEIFYHLKLFIYFSILTRTGIAPKDAIQILSWTFGWLF